MRVKFTLRPLQLELERADRPHKQATMRAELRLYRFAMTRVLAEVMDENRRLRQGRGLTKRPLWIEALVWYADRRWRAQGTRGPALERLQPGENPAADTSSGWHGGGYA